MNAEEADYKRILVMGVGRSGTTAIYGLLQKILEDRFPGDVDYVYEPFLWDRKTFGKIYAQIKDEFRFAASLSVEGIYHHKRLPNFVSEDSTIDESSRAWLANMLSPGNGKHQYLGKMIRANGRIRLLRELGPNTKIVFVIRNPVDVLNSATQLFSFFGNEFYESDLPRFAAEVADRFGQKVQSGSTELSAIEAEYAYWYFSNLSFLEYASDHPENVYSIAYEAFLENRSDSIQDICAFLGIDFRPDFVDASQAALGPVQHKFSALAQAEYLYARSRVGAYEALLELVERTPSRPVEDLIKTVDWNRDAAVRSELPHFNALYARTEIRKKELQLEELMKWHKQVSEELHQVRASKRYRFINRILEPIDRLKSRMRRKAN